MLRLPSVLVPGYYCLLVLDIVDYSGYGGVNVRVNGCRSLELALVLIVVKKGIPLS